MLEPTSPERPARATRRPLASLIVHALLIATSFAMLYPLLWMLAASFKPQEEIFSSTSLVPQQFTLDGYVSGWSGLSVDFGRFFLNSLTISLLSIAGNLIACSLAAFAFARLQFPGRKPLFAILLLTMMLPYHVTLIPQYVMFFNLGWVNTLLPLIVPKFLAVDAFFIFMMVQFFRGIPHEIQEAAIIDGCNPLQVYWYAILPLSTPVLATAAIFTFIFTWDDFFGPLIYLSDVRKYTVSLGLRTFVDGTGISNWGAVFAMSCLALVPVLLLFLFFQRFLIQGIATTGIKR
ncbi:carbohydrate ABC transporter permease [Devosia sp. Root105]|uniref:carbohydrate ABC transporter permease n=1 Tax=Devosia sp. Root105 TaxID=1736423 RepID=UPI0006FCFE94|nr:carbohydrate ABC transporter permease [Devosia sp. Root105]KQU95047.1 sugar ABC transporter permease [Devosia sp. Root105]